MDISQKTEIELKALAFDEIAKLEVAQRNLQIINAELSKRAKEAVPPVEPAPSAN